MSNTKGDSLLQACCIDVFDSRFDLKTPWQHDGYWYATDGRIVVRRKILKAEKQEPLNERKVPKAYKLFNKVFVGKKLPLPRLHIHAKSILCSYCQGSGSSECELCGSAKQCKICGGLGKHPMVLNRVIAGRYYLLLRAFGKVFVYDDGKDCLQPIAFRAGAFSGLLMPLESV